MTNLYGVTFGVRAQAICYATSSSLYFYFFFTPPWREIISYHLINLNQIFSSGKNMGADDLSDIRCPIAQWTLLLEPILTQTLLILSMLPMGGRN